VTLGTPFGTRTRVRPLFVVGAKGLLAGEFLRLASEHPLLELAGAVTRSGGEPLASLHAHVPAQSPGDGATIALHQLPDWIVEAAACAEAAPVLVLALPHGEAATLWRGLRDELGPLADELVVVDLSADHRLREASAYERWYGATHPDPAEAARFVYGLPELAPGPLAGATRIAVPGCFATALQLATIPAARAGVLDHTKTWFLSGITGSSGSGATPSATTHHPHRHANLWAYALGGHRHEAELEQALALAGCAQPPVSFVPHSGPFVRGIHLTAVLPVSGGVGALGPAEARALYAGAYADATCVEVLADGVPDLGRVVGSNRAALACVPRGESLVVLVALDNVLKGGAGQALQCLNLALGWPETTGLPLSGLGVL